MISEPSVEYFYGDTLRWSFGFDNPNKAAVIFACLLPLLFHAWVMAWRLGSPWLRCFASLFSGTAFLLAGYCLCMTFSRGALVAAVTGLGYVIGLTLLFERRKALGRGPDADGENTRPRMNRDAPALPDGGVQNAALDRDHGSCPYAGASRVSGEGAANSTRRRVRSPLKRWIAHGLLLAGFSLLVVWTGLGARTGEAAEGDRSVGNRFDIWSAALQMSVENPRGFGAGRSGEEYMQWYQATDREEGYRTMVNSYLTFLVEYGWVWFALSVITFSCFWTWTETGVGKGFAVGLRGLLIAFLVAGIFSTTMEEWRLWILPGLAILGLVVAKCRDGLGISKRSLAISLGGGAVCLLVLFCSGVMESAKDPLHREFGQTIGGRGVTRISKKGAEGKELGILPDPSVLGDFHGKLLRELAADGKSAVVLGADAVSARRILLMGSAVSSKLPSQVNELFLLSPDIADESVIRRIKASDAKVHLLLGEIDEDGRIGFWEEIAESEGWAINWLQGVGIRADWAWEEVTELTGE